ncbi:MAG: C4-type zinc ribbon domain-containing protein [Actinomycetota bacterium]
MASPAYELILQIQGLDLSIDQLRHRAASHPDREAIAAIDAELAAHDAEAAELEERRHAVERDRKRLEDEVALLRDRRTEIDGKLYGGEVTASKELLALQEEAAGLLDRQNALEDDELELMEQLEELAGELGARSETRAGIEANRQAAQERLDEAIGDIDGEIGGLATERAAAVVPEPPVAGWVDLLSQYDRLRPQFDGNPVARLVGSLCDGCHIQLSAVAVDQLGKMPEDAVVTCEECGRLLVR